ncbi:MAG: hypothetical protein ACHP7O_04895 [Burkholderiales bacterium]
MTLRRFQRMLSKQRSLHVATAATIAILSAPQVFAEVVAPAPLIQTQTQARAAQNQSGMQMLTEQKLSEISGQALFANDFSNWLDLDQPSGNTSATQNWASSTLHSISSQTSGRQILGDMVTLANPLLLLLSADTTVKDVVFGNAATPVFNKDGSVALSVPNWIGDVNFQNIRVAGNTGTFFGSMDIQNINLTGTTLTLKMH